MAAPPDLARPTGLIVSSLVVVAALLPPETSGVSLAGCAILLALASVLASASGRLPATAGACLVALPALALLARFALTPGAAFEPIVVAILAVGGGTAAYAARGERLAARLAVVVASSGALVAARACYDAIWGLDEMAAQIRDAAATVPDAAAIAGRLSQGRAYAGHATPAAAGIWIAAAMCATAGLAIAAAGRRKLVAVAALVLQAAGLLATRSLTAAGALLVAVLLAGALWRLRRLLAPAAALIAILAIAAALRSGQGLARASDDNPWRLRAGNVRIGVAMAADHPWLGVGPGGFGEEFPRYRRAGDNESRHAHCLPVEMAAELGWLPGIAVSLLFAAAFLGPILSRRGAPPIERGLTVGLAAFAIHNLADFTAYLPSLLFLSCTVRGALGAPAGSSVPSRALRVGWGGAVCACAAIACAAGLSEAAIAEARQAVLEGDGVRAAVAAGRAARLAPWSADAALLHAQTLTSDPHGALAEADRAVCWAPCRASARDVRGRLRARLGDVPGAFADFTRAAALHPLRSEYADHAAQAAGALPRPPVESSPR